MPPLVRLPSFGLLLLAACHEDTLNLPKGADPFDDGDPTTDTAGAPSEACNGEDDDGDGAIDEGFPDGDGDGVADCMEDACPPMDVPPAAALAPVATCDVPYTGRVPSPEAVRVEWTAAGFHINGGPMSAPAVGPLTDDNGDGEVDERDVPDIAFAVDGGSDANADQLVAVSGDGSGELFRLDGFDGSGGVVVADVDVDGVPDVLAGVGGQVFAVDATGRLLWESERWVDTTGVTTPTVADLDGDGDVEVVTANAVLDGADGALLAWLSINPADTHPVVADLDLDGVQEVVVSGHVFDADGALRWARADDQEYHSFAAVVNADADDAGEVVLVRSGDAGEVAVEAYDTDGAALWRWEAPLDRDMAAAGPPCAGDLDGDGDAELAVYLHDGRTYAFDLAGAPLWAVEIASSSAHTPGCVAADLDGDGAMEVIVEQLRGLAILDGASGTLVFEENGHGNGLHIDAPVVADVDDDGAAEIVLGGVYGTEPALIVYGHDGGGWAPAGPTWGIPDFAGTNLGADASVPASPDPPWLEAPPVFRARPVGPADGPDLVVAFVDACVVDCDAGPNEVVVQVGNQGLVDAPAGLGLAVFADEGATQRLVAIQTLPEVPAGRWLAAEQLQLAPGSVGPYGFSVSVDDDGAGVGALVECDEANNRAQWRSTECP